MNIFTKYKLLKKNYNDIRKIPTILLRWQTAPFEKIVEYCPKEGRVLDIGCSYGLLELLLVNRSSKIKILAVDPSKAKIKVAQTLNKRYSNVKFKQGFLADFNLKDKFKAILIIDVLYLLPRREKITLLASARDLLEKDGLIFVNTIDKKPAVGFYLAFLQEAISVMVIKRTFSKKRGLFFASEGQYQAIFKKANLSIVRKIAIKKCLFYPYLLFILKKGKIK